MTTQRDSDRWQRVGDIFHEALQRRGAAREDYLTAACQAQPGLRQEVDDLLRAHDGDGPLDLLGQDLESEVRAALPPDPDPGALVGPYRLLDRVGKGGMGLVFRAERGDGQFEQRVALKVLRAGFDTDDLRARFLAERRILAQLDHPNITRLLDGGVTDAGVPYFAMEFVKGTPIDDYCDLNRLTVPERLELFREVCDAMQYAHRNLVVHRDLKPANILVTDDGVVKVLDFGIAKLLLDEDGAGLTRTGRRWLTPEYASPEQVRGEPVTTASDVYALGVLLYELLTGRRPYRVAPLTMSEMERAILESEPTRPSAAIGVLPRDEPGPEDDLITVERTSEARGVTPARLRRQLAGDLDTIVLKSLRKEPDRRYGTASELAEDIARHLRGLPVYAQADTAFYRMSKFVRRHRVGVAATVAATLALVAGGIGTAWQAQRATAQARLATEERDKAEQVTDLMIDLFRAADPGRALGRDMTVTEFIDSGAVRIESELADQPLVQARMLDVMGQLYRAVGRYDDAERVLRGALAIRRDSLSADHADLAKTLDHLGNLLSTRGRFADAEPFFVEALAIRGRTVTEEDSDYLAAINNVASVMVRTGNLDSAGALYRRVIAARRRTGQDDEDMGPNLTNLAYVLGLQGRYAEADSVNQILLELLRGLLDPKHPSIASALNARGVSRYRLGDRDGARDYLEQALAINREVLGPRHPMIGSALHNLAAITASAGAHDSARALYREALDIKRAANLDPVLLSTTVNNLGMVHLRLGEYETAEALLRESLASRSAALDPGHVDVARAQHNLAVLYREQARWREAEDLLRRALATRERQLAEDHWHIAATRSELGAVLAGQERYGEAAEVLLEAYAVLDRQVDAQRDQWQVTARRLAEVYDALGRAERAAALRARLDEV